MNFKTLLGWVGGIGLIFFGITFLIGGIWEFILGFSLPGLLLLPPVQKKLPFKFEFTKWVLIAVLCLIVATVFANPKLEAQSREDFREHKADIIKTINVLYSAGKYQDAKSSADRYASVDDPDFQGLKDKIDVAIEKEKADEEQRHLYRQFIAVTEENIRAKLKDPDSAQFRGEYISSFKNGKSKVTVVCGEVNSKNAFGGYSGFQHFVAGGATSYLEEQYPNFAAEWKRACSHLE